MIEQNILSDLLSHLYKESLLGEIFKLVYPNGGRKTNLKIDEIIKISDFSDDLFKLCFAIFMWRLSTNNQEEVIFLVENNNLNNVCNLLEGMYLVIENCWIPNSKESDPQSGLDIHYAAVLRLLFIFDHFLKEHDIEDNLLERINQKLSYINEKSNNIKYYENSLFSLIYSFGVIIHRKSIVKNKTVEYLTSLVFNEKMPIFIRKLSKEILLQDIYSLNNPKKFINISLNDKLFENLIKLNKDEYISINGFDKGEKYIISLPICI